MKNQERLVDNILAGAGEPPQIMILMLMFMADLLLAATNSWIKYFPIKKKVSASEINSMILLLVVPDQ